MLKQQTLLGIHNVISSQGSAGGHTHLSSQGGPTIDQRGRDHVHANLSVRQAKALGLLTSGTYGPPSTTSSKSADLQRSLENRLRARLSMTGSILYTLTWKPWVTPSGVCRSRLRASVRRTSETGISGWPTPSVRDHKGGYQGGRMRDGKISTDTLDVAAQLADWNTPTCPVNTNGHQSGNNRYISHVVNLVKCNQAARLTVSGEMLTGSDAGMESGGQLNPAHSRWLMGYPAEWDCCGATAMQSFRKVRRNS